LIEQIEKIHPVTRRKILDIFGDEISRSHEKNDEGATGIINEDVDGNYIDVIENAQTLRKNISLKSGPHCRNFCFNIMICADGPDTLLSKNCDVEEKRFAKLKHTRADVLRMNEYFNNGSIFMPDLVFPLGGRPGDATFVEDVLVSNPTIQELNDIAALCKEFFSANLEDPEWCGGQINLYFSGHGSIDEKTHDASLVFLDNLLTSNDYIEFLNKCVPVNNTSSWLDFNEFGRCKVNLTLDCCHSAAFAFDVYEAICRQRIDFVPGDFRCACLPHQKSNEYLKLGHGLYSYSFLSENLFDFEETKYQITEKSIARSTDYNQIPLRFGFHEDGVFVRLPGTDLAEINQELMSEISSSIVNVLNEVFTGENERYKFRNALQQVSHFLRTQ